MAEYWVVGRRAIERRTGVDLLDVEAIERSLTSPLLPGFALDVAALLAG